MSGKVLVVDDSPTVLAAVERTLVLGGWEVRTQMQPLLLAESLRGWKPDVLLLDVEMPALSGPKLMEVAKGMLVGVRIVFYSSKPEFQLRELTQTAGAAGYIEKSGDLASLPLRLAEVSGMTKAASLAPRLEVPSPRSIKDAHEAIRNAADELRAAVAGPNPGPAAFRTLVSAFTHCDEHFSDEARRAADGGFSGWPAHAADHDRFRSELDRLLPRFRAGETTEVAAELLRLLDDHVTRHYADFDRPLLRFLSLDETTAMRRR